MNCPFVLLTMLSQEGDVEISILQSGKSFGVSDVGLYGRTGSVRTPEACSITVFLVTLRSVYLYYTPCCIAG
jgi:hypothetical protein